MTTHFYYSGKKETAGGAKAWKFGEVRKHYNSSSGTLINYRYFSSSMYYLRCEYRENVNSGSSSWWPSSGSTKSLSGSFCVLKDIDIPSSAIISDARIYVSWRSFNPVSLPIPSSGARIDIVARDADTTDKTTNISGNYTENDSTNMWNSSYGTSASVTWYVTNTGGYVTGSPNIKTVIQEIIDRPGWEAGNNIEIALKPREMGYYPYELMHGIAWSENAVRLKITFSSDIEVSTPSPASTRGLAVMGSTRKDSYPIEAEEIATAVASASVGNVAIEGEPSVNVVAATALFVGSASVGDVVTAWEPVSATAATAVASAISPKLHILSDDSIVSMDHLVHNYQGVTIYQTHEGEIKFATGYGTAAPASIPANSISSMDSVSTPNGDFYAIYQAADGTIKVRK